MMEFYVELKLRSDRHNNGFSNGLTLCGSQSTTDFSVVSESDNAVVYQNDKQHLVTLNRENRDGVTAYSTTFTNNGDTPATLEMLSSFAIKGIKTDKIHRLQSFWSAEGRLRTETFEDLHLESSWANFGMRCEKFGNIGSMPVRKYFPFVALENSETGEFIAVQLYTPSSWQIELLCVAENLISLVGGIADRDFGHWFKHMAPGETFTTPKAVVAVGKSLAEVCDKLIKAQQPDISAVDQEMGIIFNEYCTTWGNPSFENVKKIADKLKGKGIQYFIIDAGWNGNGNIWWSTIGDWDANKTLFPGGLKQATDYIRSCGMIPGLWFEMENVGANASHYNDAEHLLKKDGVIIASGEKHFWDMTSPWVVDYLTKSVIGTLKDCGFGYIKVDYNDTIGIGCDGVESLGEGLRQRVLASQAFFRKMKAEIPDLVIENCSSGGHRLEPSMMELVSQASFSDAHETTAIPIVAANLHRAIRPSQSQIWATLRAKDDDNRLYYSLISTFLGRMCLSGDINDLSDAQWFIVDEAMDFYRAAADIIRHGITTRYENDVKSYNHPQGEQLLVREYENRILVIAHRFEHSKAVDVSFLNGYDVQRTFGKLEDDFSAMAWLAVKK